MTIHIHSKVVMAALPGSNSVLVNTRVYCDIPIISSTNTLVPSEKRIVFITSSIIEIRCTDKMKKSMAIIQVIQLGECKWSNTGLSQLLPTALN